MVAKRQGEKGRALGTIEKVGKYQITQDTESGLDDKNKRPSLRVLSRNE